MAQTKGSHKETLSDARFSQKLSSHHDIIDLHEVRDKMTHGRLQTEQNSDSFGLGSNSVTHTNSTSNSRPRSNHDSQKINVFSSTGRLPNGQNGAKYDQYLRDHELSKHDSCSPINQAEQSRYATVQYDNDRQRRLEVTIQDHSKVATAHNSHHNSIHQGYSSHAYRAANPDSMKNQLRQDRPPKHFYEKAYRSEKTISPVVPSSNETGRKEAEMRNNSDYSIVENP